jgi:hypothetical protein
VSYGLACAAAGTCSVRGAVGAGVGGAVGGAIAGACYGTVVAAVGCGAVGGTTSYLIQSAITGQRATLGGVAFSAAVGAAGNSVAYGAGRIGGTPNYFARPLPGNALANTAGALSAALFNDAPDCGPGPGRNPDGSFTSGGQSPWMDPAGVPLPR